MPSKYLFPLLVSVNATKVSVSIYVCMYVVGLFLLGKKNKILKKRKIHIDEREKEEEGIVHFNSISFHDAVLIE